VTAANLGFFNRAALPAAAATTALVELPPAGGDAAPRSVTHGELDRRMDAVAAGLARAGLGPGDRLLVATGNGIAFVEAMFGAMRLGVQPVPLNTALGAPTIAHIVKDAGIAGVVGDVEAAPHLTEVELPARRWAVTPAPGWAAWDDLLAHGTDYEPFAPPPGTPAFVAYTSGSSGRPKGVLLAHEGMLWSIRLVERLAPLPVDACAVAATPLYHKNAMRGVIKPYLRAGATVVLLKRFDARQFVRALADYGATFTSGVPAIFSRALAERALIDRLSFPRLKSVAIGSAVVTEALATAVETAFGTTVKTAYGLTEAGGPLQPPGDGRPVPRGSVGVAAPEGEVELRDDDGQPTDAGELWVRNPAVTLGYLNLPDETAGRLVDGWFKTGDRFRRDAEGFYFFVGRTDEMFNCGGENLYPKEVEDLIARHPDVAEVAVAPVPHPEKGQAPAALVVPRPGAALTPDEVRRFCLVHGPAYAHPRTVRLVDTLPMLGTGKLDRRAVRALLVKEG